MRFLEKKRTLQKNTKSVILEAAENLFSKNGFRRTSIKLIAKSAGVNIAAVNYHFGSKYSLIEMVIKRRFVPINEQRIERLKKISDSYHLTKIKPSINEILYAYIEPLFSSYTNKKKSHLSIACQIFLEQDETILKFFMLLFKESFFLLYQLLKETLPNTPECILSWRVHYAIGSIIYCMRIYSTEFPVPEIAPYQITSLDEIVNDLTNFIIGGLNAPLK